MSNTELPSFVSSAHTHTMYNTQHLMGAQTAAYTPYQAQINLQYPTAISNLHYPTAIPNLQYAQLGHTAKVPQTKEIIVAKPQRRLVQVFIADTDENVPLENMLLYRGEQILTDLTDQELFFDIDIKKILADHNAERTKIVDPEKSGTPNTLTAARVRDLKMTVVTIATF